MARSRRRAHVAGRILGLLLLIIGLSFIGLLWFDILGIVDARALLYPVLKTVGLTPSAQRINPDDPLLLDRERLIKSEKEVLLDREDLQIQAKNLAKKDEEVQQKLSALEDRIKQEKDRENSFNAMKKMAEDRKANLEQSALYLNSMPPSKAVPILLQMDDQSIIDLFRVVDAQAQAQGKSSIVPAWLAQMPPDRAAAIQRKMVLKPGN
ncbi:MAG: flagellar protein FlbB [Spirochaetales bacterium]|nr:flagellar protein FlbB [Spirochaetales bacterium]